MDDRLNTAPCGFVSFRDDGTISLINATLLGMLGYDRDELTGRHVETILTIGSRIFYQTHWFPLLRLHGRAEEIFLKLRSKAEAEIGVLVNAARREVGGSVEYDCIMVRVAERQKYEDELLRARRVAEAARAELEEQQRETRQANERLEAQATELQLQKKQLQAQAAELEAASDELRETNEALLARTEEAEELRRAAEEANQAKSNFLAVMSHELRTPLNAIGGYVQILDLGIHGPVTDAQRETLERIDRSQRHLLRLINEVLNLARIEAGHVEYDIEDLPVAEIIAAVSPMVEPQLQMKDLAYSTDVAPGLRMRADREKVEQILLNLLSNAVKFTPSKGEVSIEVARAEEVPDRISLRIRDTGIGIPAEKLDAIFQPFEQVDSTREEDAQGSGLGLAISRDLARGMGGDLWAESTVGVGSTLTLTLPLALEE